MSPTRPRKPCAWPGGCGELVQPGVTYCDEHARTRSKRYEQGRPSAARRGYGRRWQRIRASILASSPRCSCPGCPSCCERLADVVDGERVELPGCARPSREVDHVVPLAAGGDNSPSNLQALCKPCHSRKTLEDGRFNGRKLT